MLGENYSKTCIKRPPSKRPKNGFQDRLSLNAGQQYCRMLQGEHSAILSTFIKLSFVIVSFPGHTHLLFDCMSKSQMAIDDH